MREEKYHTGGKRLGEVVVDGLVSKNHLNHYA